MKCKEGLHIRPRGFESLFTFQHVVEVSHCKDVFVCVDVCYTPTLHIEEDA